MPIKFRCSGCQSKLSVPTRWHGTSVACPRCAARVTVPADGRVQVNSLEGSGIEKSLGELAPAEAFEAAPFAVNINTTPARSRQGSRLRGRKSVGGNPPRLKPRVTIAWWTPYAYAVALLVVAVVAFFLGAWWAMQGSGP